ncbi:MAG: nucleotide exchange factor GrpE [Chloroflexi bacterium]|nr:nucleotide exchange factor GrpE [Chloroflexota bacterium]
MIDETSPLAENREKVAEDARQPEAAQAEDVEAVKAALAREKARAEEYLAGWQRAQADFINYKRRTEQEKADASKFASAMLILNLLPVLDDFQRAFASVSASLAGLTWVEGMQLVYRKMESVLEANGLSQIKAMGEKFDPRYHEAVLHKEGDEGVVIEELQRGYRLHDKVIRPALVVVGKGYERPVAEEGGEKPPATSEEAY